MKYAYLALITLVLCGCGAEREKKSFTKFMVNLDLSDAERPAIEIYEVKTVDVSAIQRSEKIALIKTISLKGEGDKGVFRYDDAAMTEMHYRYDQMRRRVLITVISSE